MSEIKFLTSNLVSYFNHAFLPQPQEYFEALQNPQSSSPEEKVSGKGFLRES